MKRIKINPRLDYKEKIKDLGFNFDSNYWLENAYYEFSEEEIYTLEVATKECHEMFISATEYIIKHNLWDKLHIPSFIVPALIRSWNNNDLSVYGRFDFAMIDDMPKMFEFNADTPTSLLEASIIQWQWKEEMLKGKDQFNSIHESLIASWIDISRYYNVNKVDFTCITDNVEDYSNTAYICSTAAEAGLDTTLFDISDMRYNGESHLTPSDEKCKALFKLYPWEWLFNEEGRDSLMQTDTLFIEPLWKAIWSNKYMLVILSDLFPDSPYILKASTKPLSSGNYCKKPIFSREGANVTLVKNNEVIDETEGEYGEEGYIYQELVEIPQFDNMYPIIGSWVIGGESCGIGIRENETRITNNMSYFVPHVF